MFARIAIAATLLVPLGTSGGFAETQLGGPKAMFPTRVVQQKAETIQAYAKAGPKTPSRPDRRVYLGGPRR